MSLIRLLLGCVFLIAAAISLGSCANTIRGIGQDTANAVDATQNAGRRTRRAVVN